MGYDITIRCARGETPTIEVEFNPDDGTATDLTGAAAYYRIYDASTRAVLAEHTTASGDIALVDNVFSWQIRGADTDREVGSYAHDFRYVLDGNEVQLFGGVLVIDEGMRA